MLKHFVFDSNPGSYLVAIFIKGQALRKADLEQYYVEPLVKRGFFKSQIIAFNLEYNDAGKAPVKLIREHLAVLEKSMARLDIKHVLVADAAYFKTLCTVKKVEPEFGYLKPTIWPGVQAAVTINWTQLFHNPSLKDRLSLGLEAIARDLKGEDAVFDKTIFGNVSYPDTSRKVENTLKKLLQYPALTCDIETVGLHLKKSGIASIAFAWNQTDGASFLVRFGYSSNITMALVREFFEEYQGKLIFHNATFDTGRLIYQLFMDSHNDMKGMLEGLHTLYRDTEDTQVLAYLATNSAAGNKLSLKELAFEYTGNYALDEIKDVGKASTKDLLKYNITDALATWFVYNKYRPIVEAEQEEVYQSLFRPSLKVITQMELCGMPLNWKQIGQTNKELSEIREQYAKTIADLEIIKLFENQLKLTAALDANKKLKKLRKTEKDFNDLQFNPRSNPQVRRLLYEELGLPVSRYTDTKLPSTDGKALEGLIEHIKKAHDL